VTATSHSGNEKSEPFRDARPLCLETILIAIVSSRCEAVNKIQPGNHYHLDLCLPNQTGLTHCVNHIPYLSNRRCSVPRIDILPRH
jgi:hypothetical protein